jgi:hypothetical protein
MRKVSLMAPGVESRFYELSGAWYLVNDLKHVTERRLANIDGIGDLVGVNLDLLNMIQDRIEERIGDPEKYLMPESKIDPNMRLRNAAP